MYIKTTIITELVPNYVVIYTYIYIFVTILPIKI